MKSISRRKFLQISGLAAGASMLPMPVKWLGAGKAEAFIQTKGVPLYGTNLRALEIPIAWPDGTAAPVTGVTHYTAHLVQYKDPGVVPTLGPTTLWGYQHVNTAQQVLTGVAPPMRHLAGIMIAERDQPVQITFINDLPLKHIIPNDLTVPGANLGDDRTTIHFHGGLFPWIADGGPFDWFCSTQRLFANKTAGESFMNNLCLTNLGTTDITDPTRSRFTQGEFYWNFNQSARLVWYHDHAWGITRINAYAGVASAILLRDNFERSLVPLGLPPNLEDVVLGKAAAPIREFPLVFQDKIFINCLNFGDPTWGSVSTAKTPGSLWYPHTYEPGRWRKVYSRRPLPLASCIPEMFGDTMLVNGTASPKTTVQARRYRFRMLNACNARFLNLQMYVASATLTPAMAARVPVGETAIEAGGMWISNLSGTPLNDAAVNNATAAPSWLQVGNECGFLTDTIAVPSNNMFTETGTYPATESLLVGCAERPDVMWDFTGYAGQQIILYNDCPGPFPGSAGDPRNDYFPGLRNGNAANVSAYALAPATKNSAPNTRVVMKFIVTSASSADLPLQLGPGTNLQGKSPLWNSEEALIVQQPDGSIVYTAFGLQNPPVITRTLSLNEEFDAWGRLQQSLSNVSLTGPGDAYIATPDILIQDRTVEIWRIQNNTADVHPMHFHMLNAQVISRTELATATVVGPRPDEMGFKETIKMWPGTITEFIFYMNPPLINDNLGVPVNNAPYIVGGKVVNSNRVPGWQYQETVWHCHILEHEEHDMMRPVYINVPGAPTVP